MGPGLVRVIADNMASVSAPTPPPPFFFFFLAIHGPVFREEGEHLEICACFVIVSVYCFTVCNWFTDCLRLSPVTLNTRLGL